MKEIDEICENGSIIKETKGINALALNSLTIALKAYLSTYQSIAFANINILKEGINYEYNEREYFLQYSETILHFQHFFELIIKDVLRAENEILALKLNSKKKPDDLVSGVLNGEFGSNEITKPQTVEFQVALDRLESLVKIEIEKENEYEFLVSKENKKILEKLNWLRNRIWHRGIYVMNYKALDLLIGQKILPLVQELMQLKSYKNVKDREWKYGKNALNIDPLTEIIKEMKKEQPEYDKVALLKELGRASYNSHLGIGFGSIVENINTQANLLAKAELDRDFSNANSIHPCPCCGAKSLVSYMEQEIEYEDDGEYRYVVNGWEYIKQVKCPHCSFTLNYRELKNLKEYKYENVPDYWKKKSVF